jgi:hypothetical protein
MDLPRTPRDEANKENAKPQPIPLRMGLPRHSSFGRTPSGPGTPASFPMSPDPIDEEGWDGLTSSPAQNLSTLPSSRRTSEVAIAGSEFFPLSRFESNISGVSGSVFSETSDAPYTEIDRKLEQFISQAESGRLEKQPASNIPTTNPDEPKKTPFSFHCAFGWTGDECEDLEETPTTKTALLGKIDEVKQGIEFVENSLYMYQEEINTRRHHKFKSAFIDNQNRAIIVTQDQLTQISAQLDNVIKEVKEIDEEDGIIKPELMDACKHAAPWIKRTQRIIFDAHVFYKLNYSMTASRLSSEKMSKPVSQP